MKIEQGVSYPISRRSFLFSLPPLLGGSLYGLHELKITKLLDTLQDPSIPEFANISEPLPYKPEDFDKDTLCVLPDGWRNNGHNATYNGYPSHDWKMLPIEKKWFTYSKDNIPSRQQIPGGILNTPSLTAFSFEDIPEFKRLQKEPNSKAKFERILQLIPPVTQADIFPELEITAEQYDKRSVALWNRINEIAEVKKRISILSSGYWNLLSDQKSHPQAEEIKNKIDQLAAIYDDLQRRFHEPVFVELTGRTSNKHFVVDERVWPKEPYMTALTLRSYCYSWVGQVIHAVCWANNDLGNSPLKINNRGAYEIRHAPDSDSRRFNIKNLFRWMNNESSKHGWTKVTGASYKHLLEIAENNFIVGVDVGRGDEVQPFHFYILRKLSCGQSEPSVLVLAELMGAPPWGELYSPIIPESDTENYDKDTELYIHPFV